MTTETEIVKAGFHADPKCRAAATMTTDARLLAAAVEVVVMTPGAGHGAVFVVRKVDRQPLTAVQKRFTHRQGRATAQQRQQRDQRAQDDCQHESRVPPKHEPAAQE